MLPRSSLMGVRVESGEAKGSQRSHIVGRRGVRGDVGEDSVCGMNI